MHARNSIKFIVGFAVCFGIRLIPFRPPNFEPLLATQMPFAERLGGLFAFVFGFLSIFMFDVFTSGVGTWTWITASMYGVLGVLAAIFFQHFGHGVGKYLVFSIFGTLLFDGVTGLMMGPILYGQPFTEALVGQVPFTAMHLVGNALLSVTLSPLVYYLVVENRALDISHVRALLGLSHEGGGV